MTTVQSRKTVRRKSDFWLKSGAKRWAGGPLSVQEL